MKRIKYPPPPSQQAHLLSFTHLLPTHPSTVCSGDCHKKWCHPVAAGMVNIEVPNWRPSTILWGPRNWKAWDLEFCTRLRKMGPSIITLLRGDMSFADFHANTIANLEDDEALRRAKKLERIHLWLTYSVLAPGCRSITSGNSPLKEDQIHLAYVLDVYHFFHVDPPRIKRLRRVWNKAHSMVDSQLVNEPSPCRCQQCLPVDPRQGTDLPSLSYEQFWQMYCKLGRA